MLFQILTVSFTREVALILNGLLIGVTIISGFDLLAKFLRADKQTRKSDTFLVFQTMALSLIGYGIYNIPSILSNYYTKLDLISIPQLFVSGANILITLMIIMPFSVVSEKIIVPKKYKINLGKASVSYSGVLGFIIISFIAISFIAEGVGSEWVQTDGFYDLLLTIMVIAYVAFGLMGFLGMVYIIFIRLGPQKEERNAIIMALIGGIIALIGGAITPGYRDVSSVAEYANITEFGGYMLIVGIAIEIAGWFMFRFFFLRIKDYDELEWKSGLEDLYIIMAETGIGVYACEFNKAATIKSSELSGEEISEKINADLIAGGLIGIKSMLSEIAGTKKGVLEVLSLKDKNLICKQGKVILAVMKAKANLGVYHTILRNVVDDIEEHNQKALEKFKGDLRTLDIDTIVKKHFGKIVDNV